MFVEYRQKISNADFLLYTLIKEDAVAVLVYQHVKNF